MKPEMQKRYQTEATGSIPDNLNMQVKQHTRCFKNYLKLLNLTPEQNRSILDIINLNLKNEGLEFDAQNNAIRLIENSVDTPNQEKLRKAVFIIDETIQSDGFKDLLLSMDLELKAVEIFIENTRNKTIEESNDSQTPKEVSNYNSFYKRLFIALKSRIKVLTNSLKYLKVSKEQQKLILEKLNYRLKDLSLEIDLETFVIEFTKELNEEESIENFKKAFLVFRETFISGDIYDYLSDINIDHQKSLIIVKNALSYDLPDSLAEKKSNRDLEKDPLREWEKVRNAFSDYTDRIYKSMRLSQTVMHKVYNYINTYLNGKGLHLNIVDFESDEMIGEFKIPAESEYIEQIKETSTQIVDAICHYNFKELLLNLGIDESNIVNLIQTVRSIDKEEILLND